MVEEFLEFEKTLRDNLYKIYIEMEPQYNQPSTNGLIRIAMVKTARLFNKPGHYVIDNESFDKIVEDLENDNEKK